MTPIYKLLLLASKLPAGNVYRDTTMEILQNMEDIPHKSIEQIAELCHTNPVTLSRLVRKIGFKNFSEFRYEYEEALKAYPLINRCIPTKYTDASPSSLVFLDFIEFIAESCKSYVTDAQLDEMAEGMHKASTIHVYCSSYDPHVISMLIHDLLLTGKKIHYCNDAETIKEDVASIGSDSFVLFIPTIVYLDQSEMLGIFEQIIKVGAGSLLVVADGNIMTHFAPGFILKYQSTGTVANVYLNNFMISMLMMTHRRLYLEESRLEDEKNFDNYVQKYIKKSLS